MPTPEVQKMMPLLKEFFSKQPISKAYLFGSFARGDNREDSDIDLLVTLDETQHVGLLRYCRIINELEDMLHRPVDMIEDSGLKDFARASAERDKILIYERQLEIRSV